MQQQLQNTVKDGNPSIMTPLHQGIYSGGSTTFFIFKHELIGNNVEIGMPSQYVNAHQNTDIDFFAIYLII